jgi:hypothetical protein
VLSYLVKDTPKTQKTLHARKEMRGFEEKRETLTHQIVIVVYKQK